MVDWIPKLGSWSCFQNSMLGLSWVVGSSCRPRLWFFSLFFLTSFLFLFSPSLLCLTVLPLSTFVLCTSCNSCTLFFADRTRSTRLSYPSFILRFPVRLHFLSAHVIVAEALSSFFFPFLFLFLGSKFVQSPFSILHIFPIFPIFPDSNYSSFFLHFQIALSAFFFFFLSFFLLLALFACLGCFLRWAKLDQPASCCFPLRDRVMLASPV